MAFLYSIIIHVYHLGIQFASLFNKKAKLWVEGRIGIFEKLRTEIGEQKKTVWFHAASLGEFEQGRPVIEAFRQNYPDHKILLTFFSPSGYEIRKNYEGVDFVYYLPIDLKRYVDRFLSIVKPQLVFIIKYEFWFNYLHKLHKLQIPVFIISANFRESQHFFKWYGGWFRKNLRLITGFFVQSPRSLILLKSIGINQVIVSGDTRFDRVVEIAKHPKKFPMMEEFVKDGIVLLAGSTWPEDEKILHDLISSNMAGFKLIIAPHEIHEAHLLQIEKIFSSQKAIRFSQAGGAEISNYNIIIIDGMGYLSSLYQYCYLAFIGGGFGKGIHNILEAVTFGKPVFFGPNFNKFTEAIDLVEKGGAFSFQEASELKPLIDRFISSDISYKKSSLVCKNYIETSIGATQKILKEISNYMS
jgi:3-deoxy-D-manno-octulosonic-acid transferase